LVFFEFSKIFERKPLLPTGWPGFSVPESQRMPINIKLWWRVGAVYIVPQLINDPSSVSVCFIFITYIRSTNKKVWKYVERFQQAITIDG